MADCSKGLGSAWESRRRGFWSSSTSLAQARRYLCPWADGKIRSYDTRVLRRNNKTGQGIEKLKSAIAQEAAQLPQMGSLMNPAWIAARDEVCGLSETNISKQKLVETCHRHGLDVSATTTLADLMHDLGRIIYYSEYEGLEKLVVLKPEWLTRAISFVLEDDVTAQDKGILQHERLKAIWNDPKRTKADRYPAKLHPYSCA